MPKSAGTWILELKTLKDNFLIRINLHDNTHPYYSILKLCYQEENAAHCSGDAHILVFMLFWYITLQWRCHVVYHAGTSPPAPKWENLL